MSQNPQSASSKNSIRDPHPQKNRSTIRIPDDQHGQSNEIRSHTIKRSFCLKDDDWPIFGDHILGDHRLGDHILGDHRLGDHIKDDMGDHILGDHRLGDHIKNDLFTRRSQKERLIF